MSDHLELRCPITWDLALLRRRLRDYAARAGMPERRLQDLVVAVNEAATNVLEHGGGSGTLTAYADPVGIWIDIVDSGGTLSDEHLTLAPDYVSGRGFGLWTVLHLCDWVSLEHPEGRSHLRLLIRYQPVSGRREKPRSAPGDPGEPNVTTTATP
jgi:anti-sigma regulatory factor (Ser/Thr protein kinase)